METTFFYKNLAKHEEELFVSYATKKLPAIENLLSTYAPDALLLNASIEKFDKHDAFQVDFCLSVGSKTLIAREASHQLEKAVDLCKDRLIAQVKKHMALLRDERDHSSIRHEETSNVEEFEFKN